MLKLNRGGYVLTVQQSVLSSLDKTYAGQRVLVTGGASFIGSHLTEALVALGATVTVADDLSSGKKEHLSAVENDVRLLVGDLRDPAFAAQATKDQQVVFHLAAQHGGRGYIESHPVEVLNNLSLDHTVFQAAATAGVGKIVYASSACAYPTILQDSSTELNWLAEDDANFEEVGKAFSDGEYGWSKLISEMQLRAFNKQYGIDGSAVRIFTAYGERENESHAAVALIAKALAKLDPYPVWGDGTQTRNFTYVGDTCAGLLLAGAKTKGFDVFNAGSPTHHTINEFIETTFDIVNWRPSEINYELDKPVGVKSRAADCSKCEKELGWKPGYTLREGIERTIEWYSEIAGTRFTSQLNSSENAEFETALMER